MLYWPVVSVQTRAMALPDAVARIAAVASRIAVRFMSCALNGGIALPTIIISVE
jgi:hypothetical protein